MLLAALLGVSACWAVPGGSRGRRGGEQLQSRSPEWVERNAPLVVAYLSTLPSDAVGQPMRGIRLSDGRRWYEGDIYRGQARMDDAKQHVHLIEQRGVLRAVLWIDEGGSALPLEACEGEWAGIRAERLGGGAYAWRALRAEHGVVVSPCPPEEWIERAR